MLEKKCKKSSKISKNELDVSWKFMYTLPRTPSRGGSKGKSDSLARPAGQGNFQSNGLSVAPRRRRDAVGTGYNLPGGVLERQKRGKEKVVTRAVACAKMVSEETGAETRY